MTEKLIARITHLEMTTRPTLSVPVPSGLRLAIMRATHMPVHFYRYMYEQVGRPHHWMARRLQSDAEVAAAIHSDAIEVPILYADGCPAGFVELDMSALPEKADVVYFGLIGDYQGRGLGKFFLAEAISIAWGYGPQKVSICTNSLDSPRALQLYQKMGFVPVGWSEEEVTPWEGN